MTIDSESVSTAAPASKGTSVAAAIPDGPFSQSNSDEVSASEYHVRFLRLRCTIRFPWIVLVSLFYFCVYFFARFGKNAETRCVLKGRLLVSFLVRMGAVYMKLGQALSTRSDLFHEPIIRQLKMLHDDCPASPTSYVKHLVERAFRRPLEDIFQSFEDEPLASGSIAQVHRATLHSGALVAVKIVKPGVREQLCIDLAVIGGVIRFCQVFSSHLKEQKALSHFQRIHKLLVCQADMRLEASNQDDLLTKFKAHPFITIPCIYRGLTSHNILVMEYMTGLKGSDFEHGSRPAQRCAERLQHAVYMMLYMGGLYHADPHPGNILFTADYRVIFVDFGVVGRLGEDEKWGLSSFFYACSRAEWERAVTRFVRYFVVDAARIHAKRESFTREFAEILEKHFQTKAERWSTFDFVTDASQLLSRYGARLTTSFTQVAFMFLVGEGFVSQLDPGIDIWKNARVFTDRYSPYMSDEVRARFDREIAEPAVNSRALRSRASGALVAPTHLDRYFVPSRYPMFVRNAWGSKIEDVDGQIFVDISCGYGPHILGYAHPGVSNAIHRAIDRGSVNALGNAAEVDLAETLVNAFLGAERCIFANSGTEAVIQAIRLCRTWRKRDRVAKFEGHYHGFSDQGLVSSWFRYSGPPSRPAAIALPGVQRWVRDQTTVLPYGDEESFAILEERKNDLACVICEPMPAVLADYDEQFLRNLSRHCQQLKIPLIFDEVVSGFRVAYGGVQTRLDIVPDLTCLGKIIGGGLPCGAVVGRAYLIEMAKGTGDPFADFEEKTFVGGTMSGNSVACSAGLAMLDHLRNHPEIYIDLEEKTNWLIAEFSKISKQHEIQFFMKGKCSIFSMTFGYRRARSTREQHGGTNFKANLALAYYMRKHGVYMPELHTMMLSAAHSSEDLHFICKAFESSLKEMILDGFFVA